MKTSLAATTFFHVVLSFRFVLFLNTMLTMKPLNAFFIYFHHCHKNIHRIPARSGVGKTHTHTQARCVNTLVQGDNDLNVPFPKLTLPHRREFSDTVCLVSPGILEEAERFPLKLPMTRKGNVGNTTGCGSVLL